MALQEKRCEPTKTVGIGQDGPHWARWEIRPWKTPTGTVGGILIFSEDITHRKQLKRHS